MFDLQKLRETFAKSTTLITQDGEEVDILSAKLNSLVNENESINKSINDLRIVIDKNQCSENNLLEFNELLKAKKNNEKEISSFLNKEYYPEIKIKNQYADALIFNSKGELLMLLRTSKDGNKELDNKWGLPGGHVDEGETPKQAVIREVAEETNLNVDDCELLDTIGKCNYFLCFANTDNLILNATEHTNLKWINSDELETLDCIYDLKERLRKYFNDYQNNFIPIIDKPIDNPFEKSIDDEFNIDLDNIVEKGDWKNHKYLRKEGEKYIYSDESGKEYSSEDIQKQIDTLQKESDDIKNKVKFSFDASLTMPDELVNDINNWKEIHKSPYGDSFYDSGDKSWDYTRPGSLRVADHWNFYSKGNYHCRTDKEVKNNETWVIAKFIPNSIKTYVYKSFYGNPTLLEQNENKILSTEEIENKYKEKKDYKIVKEDGKIFKEVYNDGKLFRKDEIEVKEVGLYKVLKEYPKEFDKQKRFYELNNKLNELKNHKIAIDKGFSSYDAMIEWNYKNESKIKKEEKKKLKEKLEAGKIFASLTKREYSKKGGRFYLESENTYTGVVTKISPTMVTIRTNDGKEFKGKDFHILEDKVEEIKTKEDALEIVKSAFDNCQISEEEYFNFLEKSKKIKIDTVILDVPLFIRLLEYAKEDAKSDLDLHKLTENVTNLCKDKNMLVMDDYEKLTNVKIEKSESSIKIGDIKKWHGRNFKYTSSGWTYDDHEKNSSLKTEKQKAKLKIQDFSNDDLELHAKRTPEKHLKKIVSEGSNPKLREIAQKELNTRAKQNEEHNLYSLMILEEADKDENANEIHFEEGKHPDDETLSHLTKLGVKHKIVKKEDSSVAK